MFIRPNIFLEGFICTSAPAIPQHCCSRQCYSSPGHLLLLLWRRSEGRSPYGRAASHLPLASHHRTILKCSFTKGRRKGKIKKWSEFGGQLIDLGNFFFKFSNICSQKLILTWTACPAYMIHALLEIKLYYKDGYLFTKLTFVMIGKMCLDQNGAILKLYCAQWQYKLALCTEYACSWVQCVYYQY